MSTECDLRPDDASSGRPRGLSLLQRPARHGSRPVERRAEETFRETDSAFSDPGLLRRYVRGGEEGAFGLLVERYQTMVTGTALRRTGSPDLARDVAQEVFITLARKASTLLGRETIGGWLHHTAMHVACRAITSEVRRRSRQDRFSEEMADHAIRTASTGNSEQLAALDEVLNTLSPADHEALVLHYFQELSYREIAERLELKEAAVRQRVCRAMERLGKRLRDRGVGTSVAALFAAALAIQESVAVPFGLAQAALAAASVSGTAGGVLAALAAALSPAAVKVAAALVIGSASVTLWRQTHLAPPPAPALTAQSAVSVLREQSRGDEFQGRLSAPARHAAFAPGHYSPPGSQPAGGDPAAAVVPATYKLAATVSRPMRSTAAGSPATVGANLSKMAPGSVPLPVVQQTPLDAVTGGGTSADDLAAVAEVAGQLQQLELYPDEAAELYATVLDQTLALSPLEHLRVEEVLRAHFEDLNLAGLTGTRPPDLRPEEWLQARSDAVDSAVRDVTEVLSSGVEGVTDRTVLHAVLDLPNQADAPAMVASATDKSPSDQTSVVTAIQTEAAKTVKSVGGLLSLPLLH